MINIWKNGKYEVKMEKEFNEHKIFVDPKNEKAYIVLGKLENGKSFLYYVDEPDIVSGGEFENDKDAIEQALKLRPTYISYDQAVINKTTEKTPMKNIEVGKEYGLGNSQNRKAYVLECNKNYALVKSDNEYINEYIVASKPELNKDNKLEWAHGAYYSTLSLAARRYENMVNNRVENINILKNLLNEEPHELYIEAVISNELRNGLEVDKNESLRLENIYDKYMNQDGAQLVSEDIYDISESLDEGEEEDEI